MPRRRGRRSVVETRSPSGDITVDVCALSGSSKNRFRTPLESTTQSNRPGPLSRSRGWWLRAAHATTKANRTCGSHMWLESRVEVDRDGGPSELRRPCEFYASAVGKASTEVPDRLAARIVARRERLRAKFGTFSVHDDIRDLRENGPR